MQVVRTIEELKGDVGHASAFIPTMGALHAGHISLVQRARQECSRVCVSIFVNPLQFGPNEDYEKYPRTEEADLKLLEKAGTDIVWLPSVEDIYGENNVILNDDMIYANPDLADRLCGLNRPGHFDGVCTVVKKLLDAVKPDRAYFGEKDYQQLMIIREMVDRLKIPVEIIGCPILREPDGLAMSSRNRYLSADERKIAAMLYQVILSEAKNPIVAAQKLESLGFQVDYLEEHWNRLFVAARLGSTRLIDNIELSC